jgi:hypothetical protein
MIKTVVSYIHLGVAGGGDLGSVQSRLFLAGECVRFFSFRIFRSSDF